MTLKWPAPTVFSAKNDPNPWRRALASVRSSILIGFILTVPAVTTVFVFDFLFRLATGWLPRGAFPRLSALWNGYLLRVLTLLLLLVVFYIVGLLVRNFFGRRLYLATDRALSKTPFIKGIYLAVRQISESFFTQRKTLFTETVMVEYPRLGLFSIGFVTSRLPREQLQVIAPLAPPHEMLAIFIPTTPNPTSGVFILARRAEIIPLSIPVSDAVSMIMSAGAVMPGGAPRENASLLDKLDALLREGADHAETAAPAARGQTP